MLWTRLYGNGDGLVPVTLTAVLSVLGNEGVDQRREVGIINKLPVRSTRGYASRLPLVTRQQE